MTETAPEENEDWSDVENDASTMTYPEYGPLPEARLSVNFVPGRPPQVTVRAHTAAELTAALNELEQGGVYAAIGSAHASLNAQASIGAGLGPASPVPPQAPVGPPMPPQAPVGPPFGPNVSVAQAPGYQGPPVPPPTAAAPQGGARNGPKPRPAEWPVCYKIEVPFPQKDAFKSYREQNKDYFKGKIFWAGGGGYWVHSDVVQALTQYNPVPA